MSSHEIMSADSLLTVNAELRRVIAAQQAELDDWQANASRAARRMLAAEADAQALRTAALAYIAASYDDRARLGAELHVLATVDHPGVLLTRELDAARAFIAEIRGAMLIGGWRDRQSALLAAYDAIVKGGSE